MSKAREKDTGKYVKHSTGLSLHPSIDKLDLAKPSAGNIANNFDRSVLDENNGRARPTMPSVSQGPTVPPQ